MILGGSTSGQLKYGRPPAPPPFPIKRIPNINIIELYSPLKSDLISGVYIVAYSLILSPVPPPTFLMSKMCLKVL